MFVNLFFIDRRGPNKWRDGQLPVNILNDWIKIRGLPDAEWASDRKSVTIGGDTYTLDDFGKINIVE